MAINCLHLHVVAPAGQGAPSRLEAWRSCVVLARAASAWIHRLSRVLASSSDRADIPGHLHIGRSFAAKQNSIHGVTETACPVPWGSRQYDRMRRAFARAVCRLDRSPRICPAHSTRRKMKRREKEDNYDKKKKKIYLNKWELASYLAQPPSVSVVPPSPLSTMAVCSSARSTDKQTSMSTLGMFVGGSPGSAAAGCG